MLISTAAFELLIQIGAPSVLLFYLQLQWPGNQPRSLILTCGDP
jgi:hypothetical protein